MVRLLKHFRQLAREERGVAMVLFALTALVLIPIAGGALDYSSALTVRARAAAAADAAALAIASRSETDHATAKKLAATLLAVQYPVSERHGATINAPAVDVSAKDSVEVTIRGSVRSLFLTVIGITELPVNVRAVARRSGGQNVDIVMVLDNTGSMAGRKLAALKAAAKKVPNSLLSDEKAGSIVQIGLVPFSASVNVGANRKAAWLKPPGKRWNGCVNARANPNDVRDTSHVEGGKWTVLTGGAACVPAPILPLTRKKGELISGIDKMAADGSTAIPLGLAWGWRVLSTKQPFTEAQQNVEGQPKVRRAIVLLTDGDNFWSTAYGQTLRKEALDNRTKTLCTNIKNAGIDLFTINFEVAEEDQQLMKDCASPSGCDGGRCNFEGTSDTIGDVFGKIVDDLRRTRLTH